MLSLMRQHRGTSNVANGVDALDIGAAVIIDHDAAAVGFDAEFLKAEILDIALNANSRDNAVDLDGLGLAAFFLNQRLDRVAALGDLGHFGFGHDLDALLFKRLARHSGDFIILDGQNLRHHFDNRHISTHGIEEAGEFDTDRTRADNQQGFRHGVRLEGVEIGPDQLAIRL